MENALPIAENDADESILDENSVHAAVLEPVNELFIPQNEGDPQLEVRFFTLVRESDERGEESGKGLYSASLFRTLDDIAEKLGGGDYWLTPRGARGQLMGSLRFFHRVSEVDYPPRSLLSGREIARGGKGRRAPSRREEEPVRISAPAPTESSADKLLAILQQERLEREREAREEKKMREEERREMRSFFMTLLQPLGTAAVAALTSWATRGPAETSTGGPIAAFQEGMAFAREISKEVREEAGASNNKDEPIGETMKAGAELIRALGEMKIA